MIAKTKQKLPGHPVRGRLLDRGILWTGVLLVASVVAFGSYYYVDQQGKSTSPAEEERMRAQLNMYEQAVIDDPNNITNRIALGDAYLSLDRFADAAAQYEAALVINDESTLGQVGLGRALMGTGDLAGAKENFQKIVERFKTEDISGQLVETSHYYLGSIALQEQDSKEAVKQLTEATNLESSDSDAWFLLGSAYNLGGQPDKAIEALDRAVLFVPDFTEAYELLVRIYDDQGNAGGALYARGMAAFSKGDLGQAVERLEAAVTASPTLAEAHAGLGMAREALGDPAAALLAYQQALHLDPENFNARSGYTRLSEPISDTSSDEEIPAGHPGTGDGATGQEVTP